MLTRIAPFSHTFLISCALFLHADLLSSQTISTLVSVTPCRIIDTRNANGPLGGPSIVANATRSINIPSSNCGIPSNALAYVLNVTIVPKKPFSYLTLWPTGQPQPFTSTINAYTGAVGANGAVVPAGTGGGVSVFATGSTDLILDISGYFVGQALPVMPTIPTFPTVVSQSSTSNTQNTAIGLNTSSAGGAQNTAVGANALAGNASGVSNTALGSGALAVNYSGFENTAIGTNALSNSPNAYYNAALGSHSMENTATYAHDNTAVGYQSLWENTAGSDNTAVGMNSLLGVTSGSNNIGIGSSAGVNISTGSNNIDIGSPGLVGDDSVIRIGADGIQRALYIPVIRDNQIIGTNDLPVYIDINSKLHIQYSSRRYKEDIYDIGDISSDIFKLRPVQFRYKQAADDGTKPVHYGLIAEEVESIYPQLVVHNKDGQIEGVQYQQLPAMLLNEMQKQQKTIARQEEAIHNLMLRIETLESQSAGTPASERSRN